MVLKVAIIIPVFNEARGVRCCLETILSYVPNLPGNTSIVVVNDGSQDNTGDIVASFPVHLIHHELNKGYGAALRSGIQYVIDNNYDYALFVDSDLTNHPKYFRLFYNKMLEGYEYIKATRYSFGGGMQGVPWHRRVWSRGGNLVARLLFHLPLTDVTNGFRAVHRSILEKLTLTEDGFPIIMEELQQAKRLIRSYVEVPYILTARTDDLGKTRFSYDLKTLYKYFYYTLKASLYGRPKTR